MLDVLINVLVLLPVSLVLADTPSAGLGATVASSSTPPLYYGHFPCLLDAIVDPSDPNNILPCVTAGFKDSKGAVANASCTPLDPLYAYYAVGAYCGIGGAYCSGTILCDYGDCQNNVCIGGPGDPCLTDNSCLGLLGCGDDGTCGSIGAACTNPASDNRGISNVDCASYYCNSHLGKCAKMAYGYPCTSPTGEANATLCVFNDGTNDCAREQKTGAYFCGLQGAKCGRDGLTCAGGLCSSEGVCVGGFGDPCASATDCYSELSCGADGTCGGAGASCALLNGCSVSGRDCLPDPVIGLPNWCNSGVCSPDSTASGGFGCVGSGSFLPLPPAETTVTPTTPNVTNTASTADSGDVPSSESSDEAGSQVTIIPNTDTQPTDSTPAAASTDNSSEAATDAVDPPVDAPDATAVDTPEEAVDLSSDSSGDISGDTSDPAADASGNSSGDSSNSADAATSADDTATAADATATTDATAAVAPTSDQMVAAIAAFAAIPTLLAMLQSLETGFQASNDKFAQEALAMQGTIDQQAIMLASLNAAVGKLSTADNAAIVANYTQEASKVQGLIDEETTIVADLKTAAGKLAPGSDAAAGARLSEQAAAIDGLIVEETALVASFKQTVANIPASGKSATAATVVVPAQIVAAGGAGASTSDDTLGSVGVTAAVISKIAVESAGTSFKLSVGIPNAMGMGFIMVGMMMI